jgi:hypothetical protein
MIVSHRYKFVFMKTKKTGGSSVELALSTLLEPGDYATILDPAEEKQRAPQFKEIVEKTTSRFSDRDYGLQNGPGYPHHGMRAINRVLGDEIVNYRTFTVERNPWDKIVSGYFYHRKNRAAKTGIDIPPSQIDFIDLIRAGQMSKFHDFPLYMHSKEQLVDELIQYQMMEVGINQILSDIGAPNISLGGFSAKAGIRPASKTDVYDMLFGDPHGDEALDYVDDRFRHEISHFSYERPF